MTDPSGVESKMPLTVAWTRVISEFDSRYGQIFSSPTAKIHLDVSGTMVDGAKDKWKHVVLFDCLLAFALHSERSDHECERRRFNQYLALRESVCVACAEAWVLRCLKKSPCIQGINEMTLDINVEIVGVPFSWSNHTNLRQLLLSQSTRKTREKRRDIVEVLFGTCPCRMKRLQDILRGVVGRIFAEVCQYNATTLSTLIQLVPHF